MLGFVDEVVVMILLVHLVIDAMANVNKVKRNTGVSVFSVSIGVLLIWTFSSLVVNGSSFTQFFKFTLSISKGFIIFYWIKKFATEGIIINEIINIIKWLILIQIPFFVVGLIIYRTGYFGDYAVGAYITGDASAVGTFFWLGILICIGKYELSRNKKYLYGSLFLAAMLIVTSTKQLTVLLPAVLGYLYIRKVRVSNFKFTLFALVGIVAVAMLYKFVEKTWMSKSFGVDTSETSLIDYVDESEKLLGYYSLIYELPGEISHPLLWGAGPGMYGSYVAMNARAPLSQKYIMSYYDLIPEGLGGTLAYRSSSVIGFWGDIGLVGLSIIFVIYLYQTFYSANNFREAKQRIPYILLIATGFLLMAQSFILNIFEGNSFTLNLFWILCGISVSSIIAKNRKVTE